MRSPLFIAFVAASLLAAAGCGSSSSGGTGGSNGSGGAADHGGAGGGSGQGGGSGAGPTDCNPPCTDQTVCVGSGTVGGAFIMPNDAGVCPSGRHLEGNACVQDLDYACQPIPTGCNGTVTCACASSSLCMSQPVCNVISANEITCVLEAP